MPDETKTGNRSGDDEPKPPTHLDTLVDTMTGTYSVTTEMSTYLLDLDTRALIRVPDADNAADLRRDGEAVSLVRVQVCNVGLPMIVVIDLLVPGVWDTTRCTTPVVSIRRLTAIGHD